MHIKDNDNSPYDKSHRFLSPVSGEFPDLNFAPFRPICSLRDTNSEPGLPVVRAGAENQPRWRLKNVLVPILNFTVIKISPFVLNFNTVA